MNLEIKKYYDTLAQSYDSDRFENSYGKFIDTQERLYLKECLNKVKSNQILDLGCGTGRLLEFANYGVDFSKNMLEISKSKFTDKKILEGTVTSIPLTNNSLDCVYCFHVIMHLDYETTTCFLSETHLKLATNGRLIFDFPSKKRRKLLNFKSENWHGANNYSFKEIKRMTKENWNIQTKQGILFLPIHRFPVFLRPFMLKIDILLCKSFLKEYASYLVIELQKK
jgi:ubiquinone/menaquinone biosynthesis C-methylase UbiE